MQFFPARASKRVRLIDGEINLLPLLVLLVVGVLVYFPVSPGPYLTDVPEVMLPLGIVGGLSVFVYLTWLRHDSTSVDRQFGHFGWLGLLVGGSAGVWLASHQLSAGFSFPHVYHQALTILSIGTAGGLLAGIATTRAQQSASPPEPDREAVLAESTWTKQSGPCPIVMELVEQLSDLDNVDPREVKPLSDYINTDVFPALRAGGDSPWQVLFYTPEYEICVNGHGTITVYGNQNPKEEPGAKLTHSSSEQSEVSSS